MSAPAIQKQRAARVMDRSFFLKITLKSAE